MTKIYEDVFGDTEVFIKAPTQEDWVQVVSKALSMGFSWIVDHDTDIKEDTWKTLKEDTVIRLSKGAGYQDIGILSTGMVSKYYVPLNYLTAEEFLNELEYEETSEELA